MRYLTVTIVVITLAACCPASALESGSGAGTTKQAVYFGARQPEMVGVPNPDYAFLETLPSEGFLVSFWTKITDVVLPPEPSVTDRPWWAAPNVIWGHTNMLAFQVFGSNWYLNSVCGNSTHRWSDEKHTKLQTRYNSNTEFIAHQGDPQRGTWVKDYSYFESDFFAFASSDGKQAFPALTEEQAKGWVWVAVQIVPDPVNQRFILRQWLKFGRTGTVFKASQQGDFATWKELKERLAADRTQDGVIAWTPAQILAWKSPSPPLSLLVGGTPSFLTKGRIDRLVTEPEAAVLESIASGTSPSTQAWASWPLVYSDGGPDLSDSSGNGRSLHRGPQSKLLAGPLAPF